MTPNTPYNPPEIVLSEDRLHKVDMALRRLRELKPWQDKLEDCGIDCSSHEQLRQHFIANLSAIQQHFGKRDPTLIG